MTFPPLYQTFRSGGHINPSLSMEYRVAVVAFFALANNAIEENKEIAEDVYSIVHPCLSDFELNNWNAVEIPVIYKSSE